MNSISLWTDLVVLFSAYPLLPLHRGYVRFESWHRTDSFLNKVMNLLHYIYKILDGLEFSSSAFSEGYEKRCVGEFYFIFVTTFQCLKETKNVEYQ